MVSLYYHTPNQSPEEMPIWYPYIITPQTKALRRCLYALRRCLWVSTIGWIQQQASTRGRVPRAIVWNGAGFRL